MTSEYILGGYTKKENNGIYRIAFHSNLYSFSERKLMTLAEGPTYLTLNQEKNTLFSIHSSGDSGGVLVLERDKDEWKVIHSLTFDTKAGCHIAYREASSTLYISNYHTSQVDVLVYQNKKLTHLQTIKHQGSSIHPNQSQSRIHFAGFDRNQRFLFVCDLGSDKIYTYKIDGEGYLTYQNHLDLQAGTGPRHMVIHPHEPYGYIVGELANNTTVVSMDSEGYLVTVNSFPNIDPNKVTSSAGAAIKISNDGNFLYVSTRFHNVITVFEICDNASHLNKIQEISSHGEIPRDFTFDPKEKFLFVPHQNSDRISIFKRNKESGLLEYINQNGLSPECVCIINL